VLVPTAIVAVAAGVVIVVAGGSSNSSGGGEITTLPSPNDLPPQIVTIVSHVPVALGTVTRAELSHALAQSAAQKGLDSSPAPGSSKYDKTAESALEELLNSIWIQGEAAELGIDATAGEIAAKRAKAKREAFKNEGQYRKFLAENHYTEADVRERVKDQILTTKMTKRIEGEGQPNRQAKQEALSNFVKHYTTKWRARTVCMPRYAIEQCRNGPAQREASTGH